MSYYNKIWVLQNCYPITNILNKIKRIISSKCISTYDFSTSYTNLVKGLWGKTVTGCILFICNSLKTENYFFTVGKITLNQDIVIPMVIDPVPYWEHVFFVVLSK